MKKYKRVMSHDTEEWCKVWRKLALGSKSDMRNSVNVNPSKYENLLFDVLLLSIPYKVSARKTQKSYLSWHWSLIQALKKNWLFGWNMTWGIWWVLTRALESLKVYTLMGYSYRIKHKKYRGVVLRKITYGFKSDIRCLVSFYTSSWK